MLTPPRDATRTWDTENPAGREVSDPIVPKSRVSRPWSWEALMKLP